MRRKEGRMKMRALMTVLVMGWRMLKLI